MKKNPALQDSPPAAGRASDILPFRRSAILAERFYRMETKFPIREKLRVGLISPTRLRVPFAFAGRAEHQ